MVELVDLTATIHEEMANHPAHGRSPVFLTGTRMNHDETEDTWRGKGVEDMSVMNGFVLFAEHNGTHVDAPVHIHPDGAGIDEVPLEECYGSAVWLDLSEAGPREAIGPDALDAAATAAGVAVEAGDTVLLHTDWDRHLPDDQETYLDDHPGLSEAGAQWLHDRDVSLVGIDCGNVDVAGATSLPAHQVFLRRDVPEKHTLVAENLRGIDRIPDHRFTFSATPLPIEGATASPVRAVAIVDAN
ncbi:cyclase family protein [Halorientalis pallida]|uniref:cyclase family protein n=1 Tax=Halorientalis pallida TaxID=2479928 RepID=UPI003C6FBF26